jgi:FtsP/CotA-like multicopper oxidase with cupredoxin domain
MRSHGLLIRVLSLLLMLALLITGSLPAFAQEPVDDISPDYAAKAAKSKERLDRMVTQAERQAAADRAKAQGFEPVQMAGPVMPGEAPRYFSHPNYANSPLPEPDVTVTVSGDGTGAEAKAIMIGPLGEVLQIVVTNPGTGYTAATVAIASNGAAPSTPAAATATVAGGAVTDIAVTDPGAGYAIKAGTGIRKFVDNLDLAIPVAIKDTVTYPDADYYEIAVVQYRAKMHTDLPPTLLRGYVQVSTSQVPGAHVQLTNALLDGTEVDIPGFFGVTPPHYLGPIIAATKDHPVRIKFYNLLPTGVDGDLFIPVDTTVMGSGMGPNKGGMMEMDPLNPECGGGYDADGNRIPKDPDCYSENRATLHLHGGISPWISDGTPHQWITPAGENTNYPQGVSVKPVPDMSDSGAANDGMMTFYYTNQQSARLMFYHDHAWGITRLNVYAGEAAGYIITDDTEKALVNQGKIPGADATIPLIIQDRTFVPSPEQLAVSDETWDSQRWGGMGNLWLPHVYSPAQSPYDTSGVNQFGRWAYGPWFWPPTSNILYGEVENPYYCGPDGLDAWGNPCDEPCDSDTGVWCEPRMMPGTPYNSMGMEAFHDTPLVNGTVYPTLTVQPKSYRFRVLNAASDRFFNLSFYQADAPGGKEVQLNPAEVAAALEDPTVFPTPLGGTEGPSWIQFGTEGGFLPAPTVLPAQPTTWVNDPTVFNAGNVDLHSLLLGPAERADVIVDFSAFAGQTLILYNDAPAAFPARDPRYDYYTGNGDYRDTGGAPSTLPGYGPNIRTVMQIVVAAAAPAPAFDLPALETAFKAESLGGMGVFKNSQHPIIVGQGAYNSAYGSNFRFTMPRDGFARITDFSLSFDTLSGVFMDNFMFKQKAIQDEMGEAFDHEYGRMSGNLGLERPLTNAGVMQNLILYPYVNPASEMIDGTALPKANLQVQPLSVASDGTQIWKVTHNGVDTHPIHVHLFDVQLINRVGWDGIIRPPEPNELGWKDTVRISPLEDTILALRPIIPVVPWELPNSIRPLNPMMPLGSTLGFNSTDANGDPTQPIVNELVNFGFEYVWHCHILSHEEMDMMRPISLAMPPTAVTNLAGVRSGSGANKKDTLTWTDNSLNETGFVLQKASDLGGPWTDQATLAPNVTTYQYTIGNTNATIYYRVIAHNKVGYDGVAGYMTLDPTSTSNVAQVVDPNVETPLAPSNLTAEAQAGLKAALAWVDNANNETGFVIERSVNGGAFAPLATVGPLAGGGAVSYNDTTVVAGNTYGYRVAAENTSGLSAWSNIAVISLAAPPNSTSWIANYAAITGGWTSQDLYPRVVGDVNGDGKDDVVGFGNNATFVSLSTGTGFGTPTAWISAYGVTAGGWTSQDLFPRMLGDVNGDGKDDIVAFGNAGTYVSLSSGTRFGAPQLWIANYGVVKGGWTSQNITPRTVADVNGDGRADVIGFGNTATYVSLSTGTKFGPPIAWITNFGASAGGWTTQDQFPRHVADVNGDGRADVVGFGNTAVSVALSTGSSFGNPRNWIQGYGPSNGGWTSQNIVPRLVSDVTGDGRADIVAFGTTYVFVSRSTGNNFSQATQWMSGYGLNGGWTSQNRMPRAMGDANGDGKSDVVAFGNLATYVRLSNLQ